MELSEKLRFASTYYNQLMVAIECTFRNDVILGSQRMNIWSVLNIRVHARVASVSVSKGTING